MVAAAILAGGRGRRLGGVIKPFLEVEGRRIIDRQLEVLRPRFARIVIVAADQDTFDARGLGIDVITDLRGPGHGPLAGLEAALDWLPAPHEALVCVAGDMPFLAPAVVEHMRDAGPSDAAAVVPLVADRPQPLCARYHRSMTAHVTAALDAGTRAMHAFIRQLEHQRPPLAVRWIDESELRHLDPRHATFRNINVPGDLASGAD